MGACLSTGAGGSAPIHPEVQYDTPDQNPANQNPVNQNPVNQDPVNQEPVTMAQTFCRGPITANGSGKSLTAEELAEVKKELEEFKHKTGFKEPVRSFMCDSETKWRFGGPPDYSLTNFMYLKERTKVHAEGSLEEIVENLVKTWEMERSHKVDPSQHQSVDAPRFHISANGWHKYSNEEAQQVGNYNVLLHGCASEVWDRENIGWQESHEKFHTAFAAFPWEVLEVFSGPPTVAFSWRHWAHFTGTYEGNKGSGELVELFGFGTATVNEKLQLVDVNIYHKPEEFLQVLKGQKPASDLERAKSVMGPGCPFMQRQQSGTGSGCPFLKGQLESKEDSKIESEMPDALLAA